MRSLRYLAAAILTGVFPACADADALDLPEYHVGDRMVWESEAGQWSETVIAVDGDMITWERSDGDVVTLSANFALPTLEYDTADDGEGENLIVSLRGELFPLQSGNWLDIRYRERANGPELKRFCHVGQESTIEVAGREFAVIEVRCQQLNRAKSWYFAPSVGTYVRYDNVHRIDGLERQDLVSIERAEP